jgi:hypothetical protein
MHRIAIDDTQDDECVTLEEIEDHGLTLADVRRRCPQADERSDPYGRPFWWRIEVEEWLDGGEAP